ncbi:hypothetical protein ACLQ25_18555 [Micromonospora sp. DT44]|uniref:hypothetical protein n=1 Tax=Micromonospora sp. DT44 TaxID=3393439 RepID=UPI003CF311A4
MTKRLPRVEFPVWDLSEHPSLSPLDFAIVEGDNGTTAVGLSRGAALGAGEGVMIWSFAPSVTQRFPLWPLQHAAMAFVAPLAAAAGITHRQAVERITHCLEDAEPATLDVDGQEVPATACSLYADWRVAASTAASVPVAVASSGRDLPTILHAA